jgi:hypothetical protein
MNAAKTAKSHIRRRRVIKSSDPIAAPFVYPEARVDFTVYIRRLEACRRCYNLTTIMSEEEEAQGNSDSIRVPKPDDWLGYKKGATPMDAHGEGFKSPTARGKELAKGLDKLKIVARPDDWLTGKTGPKGKAGRTSWKSGGMEDSSSELQVDLHDSPKTSSPSPKGKKERADWRDGGMNDSSAFRPSKVNQRRSTLPPIRPGMLLPEMEARPKEFEDLNSDEEPEDDDDAPTKISLEQSAPLSAEEDRDIEIEMGRDKIQKVREQEKTISFKAYSLYCQWRRPSKKEMKERVKKLGDKSEISEEDVDSLPWNGMGSMVNFAKMQRAITTGEAG